MHGLPAIILKIKRENNINRFMKKYYNEIGVEH